MGGALPRGRGGRRIVLAVPGWWCCRRSSGGGEMSNNNTTSRALREMERDIDNMIHTVTLMAVSSTDEAEFVTLTRIGTDLIAVRQRISDLIPPWEG